MARTATNSTQDVSTAAGTHLNGAAEPTVRQKAKTKAKSAKKAAEKTAKRAAKTAQYTAESVAEEAVSKTRKQVEKVAESGINQTEHFVGSISRAVQAAGSSLENDGMPRVAAYVNAAASGLDRAATEVDGLEASSFGTRVERIVRENPLLTMGALALAGFALAGAVKKKKA